MRIKLMAVLQCGVGALLALGASSGRSGPVDSPDVKLVDSTTTTEAVGIETSVFVHPSNYRIVLISEINADSGCAGWVSQDAGQHWHGDNDAAYSNGNGDPTAVIMRSKTGAIRYYIESLSDETSTVPPNPDNFEGQRVVYKDTTDSRISTTWSRQKVIVPGPTDKGHLWPDNNASSSDRGNLYAAWATLMQTEQEPAATVSRLTVGRSLDNGASWVNILPIDDGDVDKAEWGVNLKVSIAAGTRGHVYAVWPESGDLVSAPGLFRFKKSTNAAETWPSGAGTQVGPSFSGTYKSFEGREDVPGESGAVFTMGANSAPSVAVDTAGSIYVVWGVKGPSESPNPDIYLVKSTNEGTTWTALGANPKKVNQDGGSSAQWLPWVTWDNGTGALVVVYYDSRESSGGTDRVNLYASVSYDGGSTFQDLKVSDAYWSGDAAVRGGAGDYIGVDARDGVAYPAWVDDRETTGTFKVYTSPIQLWGVVQSSVTDSVINEDLLQLAVKAKWNTDSWSDGVDSLVATSPTGVKYTGTATPAGATASHAVTKLCTCEAGDWTYVVKSCRPGFTSRVSTAKTIRIYNCVD